MLFAHGYSGMGVVLSTLAGKLLVEAIAGETRPSSSSSPTLAPPAFPGGAALRGPLHVAGHALVRPARPPVTDPIGDLNDD